ncbi:MAG TPA: GatB/YqeY domain-containing protein [Salinivirgaceae bacterium]|nr:GatB/YqeY domain-containing protein [Salinivirgaceae bacterium]
MSFEEKINNLIKEAMKAKERERLEALRAIKSAILLERTKEGATGELTEEDFLKMISKMVKQRDDSAEIYRQQNRPELAEKEEFEASVIREFLPKQLTVQEVESHIKAIIAKTGAQSMKDMGKVMSQATAELAGKAESKTIAEITKRILSGS